MARRNLGFYCFSPPVMVATCVIESSLLIYTLVRYKLNTLTRVVAAMLFFLALFQLAEYNVCGGFGTSGATWSRVGFVAITMLPALGIHLIQTISGRGWPALKWFAYVNALGWVLLFTLNTHAFDGHVCAGNYVIFQLNHIADSYYYHYYYSWLLIGIGLSFYWTRGAKKVIRESLLLVVAGYLVFLLPTTLVNTLNPATTAGIPSIMCGFAVIFAVMLVFGIMPIMDDANRTQLARAKPDRHPRY